LKVRCGFLHGSNKDICFLVIRLEISGDILYVKELGAYRMDENTISYSISILLWVAFVSEVVGLLLLRIENDRMFILI